MSKKKRGRASSAARPGLPPTAASRSPTDRAAAPATPADSGSRRGRIGIAVATIAALGLLVLAYSQWQRHETTTAAIPTGPAASGAHFVGATACAGCHAKEFAAWQDSQHAHAMQHATDKTVLGDFNSTRFTYDGVESSFFRRDGKFFVRTDGPEGKLADFEILYTFGIYPLQQYLVGFPDGRIQALPIAWDARPKQQGGGRWYHLYPDQHISYKSELHWTRLNQNWNWMCANCHSTKLERHYNATDNTYATTWSEMNVACEACHGPGSDHLAWASKSPGSAQLAAHAKGLVVALDERAGVTWSPVPDTGNSVRSRPLTSMRELGVCAQCHSRRTTFAAGMDHEGEFWNTQAISLLTEPLYFPDGQQRDEVYDIGSFLQSKMHAHGVTCSDCHEPHSGKLRAVGNAVCAQCHAVAKYDVPTHTLHAAGSAGAQCAECHMPTRTYMGIDKRHDHSIRIPRPDLSVAQGTPNACTNCHQDRDASWAAKIIAHADGPTRKGFQTFGSVLHDAAIAAPGSVAALMALAADAGQPAIVRATAIADLQPHLSPNVLPTLELGTADSDPLVRGAALDTVLAAPPAVRVQLAAGLIDDPNLVVRIKAARALAVAPDGGMGDEMRTRLQKVFAEYVDSQRANADRPEAHMNLALFYADRRDPVAAEAQYRQALTLDPDFTPAYVNLADLYRGGGRDTDAEATLDAGLARAPGDADLSHALALLRIRQGKLAEALPLLAEAVQAAPDNSHYAYVYGVALHDSGQGKQATVVLERALARSPGDQELLSTLAAYARDAGDTRRAEAYARRLAGLGRP